MTRDEQIAKASRDCIVMPGPNHEQAAFVKGAQWADEHPADRWVRVEDRLPESDEYVMWWHESGAIIFEAIDKDWDDDYLEYFLSGYGHKEVSGPITHWQPLPEAPK